MNISELYKIVEDKCISVIKTGSQVLPYIENPYDKDYVFIFNTEEDMIESKNKFYETVNRKELSENHINIHFDYLERFSESSRYSGLGSHLTCIYGDDSCLQNVKGILDDKDYYKKRCIDIYNKLCDMQEHNPKLRFYYRKHWYYCYRMMSILTNDSYNLTEEQIYNINILHDRTSSEEKRKEIIDNMIKEIKQCQI